MLNIIFIPFLIIICYFAFSNLYKWLYPSVKSSNELTNMDTSAFSFFSKFTIIVSIAGVVLLYILLMYNSFIVDIKEHYSAEFATPYEQVSDLRGYGSGFLDTGIIFCFKSNYAVGLRDEREYKIIKESNEKEKLIKMFQERFSSNKYEIYNKALMNLSSIIIKIVVL